MTRRKFETLDDCREAIEDAITTNGPRMLDIIAVVLSAADKKFGLHGVNALVDEYDLAGKPTVPA